MTWEEKEIQRLIKEHGGVLKRTTGHFVYEFPDGRIFTLSSTPSDSRRSYRNALSDLRTKVLKLQRPEVIGERRERKQKHRTPKPVNFPKHSVCPRDLQTALREALRISSK